MNRSPLRPIVKPASIVLFGASTTTETIGGSLTRNLLEGGFTGRVHLVNPRHSSVNDQPCHPTLESIDDLIELALIATPIETVPDILAQCGKRHIKAAIVYSADLSYQTDSCGRNAIITAARKFNIRLLGPGALGVIRPHLKLNATPFNREFTAGNLAFVSQSDAICAGILDWAFTDDFALSAVFAPGDESDLGLAETLDFLATDHTTESILLYLENIPDSRKFMSALRTAARAKPVVAVKAGRSQNNGINNPKIDANIDNDSTFNAVLRRAGVLRVRSVGDLFAAARALTSRNKPLGSRLAIITNGSGPDFIATDIAIEQSIDVPPLSELTQMALAASLGHTITKSNPLDLLFDASPERFAKAVTACRNDSEIDGLLVIISPNSLFSPLETAEAIIKCSASDTKPVLVCVLGESSVRDTRRRLTQAGIPVFRTPESAVTAFSFMVQYVRNQQLLLETPGALSSYQAPDIAAATALCTSALERGQDTLSATEIQRLFKAFHINIFPGIVAAPENGHRLLSLHICRDNCIGPLIELALGSPGRDLTPPGPVALPPLNDRLIDDYFRQDAISRLLGETATLPAVSQDALRRLLLRVSEIACELPWIESFKIDPLIADDYAVRPVNVQITLRQSPPPGSRYPHMAIRPYPVALETTWFDKKDQPYTIRPIRPEDAQAFQNFVRQLSHQSRYFRFFGAMRELPAMQLARHTQIDYDREMILVAVRKDEHNQDSIIGEAFYGVLEDERTCEFGVVIADHLSGLGIGSRIMHCLMDIARERGMRQMIGEVLAENEPMQGMMNALGFSVNLTDNPEIMELFFQL